MARLDDGAGFVGTGFTSGDYDDLMAKLNAAAETPLPVGPDENAWSSDSLSDERDRYETKGTRTVSFDYEYATFVWLAEHLAILRDEWHCDSNSALFVQLVSEATGTTPPASLEESPADGQAPERPEDAVSGPNEYAAGDVPTPAAVGPAEGAGDPR
jgi:hypothetical protein